MFSQLIEIVIIPKNSYTKTSPNQKCIFLPKYLPPLSTPSHEFLNAPVLRRTRNKVIGSNLLTAARPQAPPRRSLSSIVRPGVSVALSSGNDVVLHDQESWPPQTKALVHRAILFLSLVRHFYVISKVIVLLATFRSQRFGFVSLMYCTSLTYISKECGFTVHSDERTDFCRHATQAE